MLIHLLLTLALDITSANECSPAEIRDLTTATTQTYRLTCRATLRGQNVTRPVLIEGAEASGAGVDCGGGAIGRQDRQVTNATPTIAIRSRRLAGPPVSWSAPTDITFKDCTVFGMVRVFGMGANYHSEDSRVSSRQPGHTERAQRAAPKRLTFDDVTFFATAGVPLYVGPGTTNVRVSDSRFYGHSTGTAVYLDAETADNVIERTMFNLSTDGREMIAVDGSAYNRIVGNIFNLAGRRGVLLYRNCGEAGIIRHQTPSENVIEDNTFHQARSSSETVIVGSREGRQSFCDADAGYDLGSSMDDGDHATGNIVRRNRVQ
jgi:hypothetical protein